MKELEKILEEIDDLIIHSAWPHLNLIEKEKVEEIIREHMDDDYWIQVEEELQKYRDTGLTLGEIAELKERDTAKTPEYENNEEYDNWICPNCRKYYEVDYDDCDFCPNCGQRLLQ